MELHAFCQARHSSMYPSKISISIFQALTQHPRLILNIALLIFYYNCFTWFFCIFSLRLSKFTLYPSPACFVPWETVQIAHPRVLWPLASSWIWPMEVMRLKVSRWWGREVKIFIFPTFSLSGHSLTGSAFLYARNPAPFHSSFWYPLPVDMTPISFQKHLGSNSFWLLLSLGASLYLVVFLKHTHSSVNGFITKFSSSYSFECGICFSWSILCLIRLSLNYDNLKGKDQDWGKKKKRLRYFPSTMPSSAPRS